MRRAPHRRAECESSDGQETGCGVHVTWSDRWVENAILSALSRRGAEQPRPVGFGLDSLERAAGHHHSNQHTLTQRQPFLPPIAFLRVAVSVSD